MAEPPPHGRSGPLAATELRALSRAVSTIENRRDGHEALLRDAYRSGSHTTVIGVTGPPGAGKSTLVDALAAHWGTHGQRTAILAVDPSSPFSGGAVLGDRIRMERSTALENVFCRSLSARGHAGGLNEAACDIVTVLAHHGFGRVLVETVGAGQSDVEVAGMADCTVVVAVPGLGDQVQALKAGIMEIADVYAVNKQDLPGAASTVQQIEDTLALAYAGAAGANPRPAGLAATPPCSPGARALMRRHGDAWNEASTWRPPVLPVSARGGEGVVALAVAVDDFVQWAHGSGRLERKRSERAHGQIMGILAHRLLAPFGGRVSRDGTVPASLANLVAAVVRGEVSPSEAADALLGTRRGCDDERSGVSCDE